MQPRSEPLTYLPRQVPFALASQVWGGVSAYFNAAMTAYAAAAEYERLSHLSDAELMRRRMSRADLQRLVFARLTR